MAGLSGFSYYKEITISNTNVDSDIANFPVYIPIVADADIGAVCRADGFDIQFANADNSEVLTFERLPGFAVASGEASGDFYVLVPSVTTASTTIIRCYYGKADATDASSPGNTFPASDTGWAAVWHCHDATTSTIADATSNGYTLTKGAANQPLVSDGKIYKCQDFGLKTNAYYATASAGFNEAEFMIEFWGNPSSNTGGSYITSGSNYRVAVKDFQSGYWNVYNNGWPTGDGADLQIAADNGSWQHIAYGSDGTNIVGYKNGVPTVTHAGNLNIGPPLTEYVIGTSSNHSYPYAGKLEEVRISNILRSDAWIEFTFYNSHDGHAAGNELTWGAEQGLAVAYRQQVIMVM